MSQRLRLLPAAIRSKLKHKNPYSSRIESRVSTSSADTERLFQSGVMLAPRWPVTNQTRTLMKPPKNEALGRTKLFAWGWVWVWEPKEFNAQSGDVKGCRENQKRRFRDKRNVNCRGGNNSGARWGAAEMKNSNIWPFRKGRKRKMQLAVDCLTATVNLREYNKEKGWS